MKTTYWRLFGYLQTTGWGFIFIFTKGPRLPVEPGHMAEGAMSSGALLTEPFSELYIRRALCSSVFF